MLKSSGFIYNVSLLTCKNAKKINRHGYILLCLHVLANKPNKKQYLELEYVYKLCVLMYVFFVTQLKICMKLAVVVDMSLQCNIGACLLQQKSLQLYQELFVCRELAVHCREGCVVDKRYMQLFILSSVLQRAFLPL